MPLEPPDPLTIASGLRIQVESLRQLAALHLTDPFYARAAEQLAAIIAGLDERAAPGPMKAT